MALQIDENVCVGCGTCANTCPVGAVVETDTKKYVIEEDCLECGACAANCPVGAIE